MDPDRAYCISFQRNYGLVAGVRGSVDMSEIRRLSDQELSLRQCPVPHQLFLVSKDYPKRDLPSNHQSLTKSQKLALQSERNRKLHEFELLHSTCLLQRYSHLAPILITTELIERFCAEVRSLKKSMADYMKRYLHERLASFLNAGVMNVPGCQPFTTPDDVRRWLSRNTDPLNASSIEKILKHINAVLPAHSEERTKACKNMMRHYGLYLNPADSMIMQKKPENSNFYFYIGDCFGNFANSFKRCGRRAKGSINFQKGATAEVFYAQNNLVMPAQSNNLPALPSFGNLYGNQQSAMQQYLEHHHALLQSQARLQQFIPGMLNGTPSLPPPTLHNMMAPGVLPSNTPPCNYYPFATPAEPPVHPTPPHPLRKYLLTTPLLYMIASQTMTTCLVLHLVFGQD